MEKFLYPNHPFRCITTGPSEYGKTGFLTILFLNIIHEYKQIYIFSPSLHQYLYQKSNKCFTKYIPIHIISNNLQKEDIDVVIEERVNNKDFDNSKTEIKTHESIEELIFPQDFEDNGILILDDSSEKEMNNPRVQAMFKRSRHNNLPIFTKSQD